MSSLECSYLRVPGPGGRDLLPGEGIGFTHQSLVDQSQQDPITPTSMTALTGKDLQQLSMAESERMDWANGATTSYSHMDTQPARLLQ